jgi:hypothetical protein
MTHLESLSKARGGLARKNKKDGGGVCSKSKYKKVKNERGGDMPKMPCLVCKKLTDGNSRCDAHQKMWDDQAEAKRRARKLATGQYSGDYKARARMVRENAYVCHLCNEGPKLNDPWQADHINPADPYSPLAAAHRSCNARRGNKPIKDSVED